MLSEVDDAINGKSSGKKKNTPSKDMKDLQTLPEFNVISAVPGSEYENTLKYLQNLEEYAGRGYYNLWEKSGEPNIELLSDGKKRPYFNPLSNTMKLVDIVTKYKNYPFYPELQFGEIKDILVPPDDFISELTHAKQLKDKGLLKFIGKGVSDWFKSPYFTAYGLFNKPSQYETGALWGEGQYETPGTIEYEAHKQIEPALYKELIDNLDKQTNYKIDVLKKEYGGELEKFVDGGGKKGTKENPFELPEITITPDTKRQAEMAEMYKYMPEDVKRAIAYDMENPDELSIPKEPTTFDRIGDYANIGLHPFEALAHINQDRSKGDLFGPNWYEMKKQERGVNPLDLAFQGAAAARLAGAVLPGALPWLNAPAVVAGTTLPGATMGNFLASQGIANTLLRESGYSGDEDPSTVREWEKYKEGTQDLSTTLANTGVNLLDVGLTAFGDFKPFIAETAKELKRDYKTVKDAFDTKPTMGDVIGKIMDLKTKNPTSFRDAKMPFRELKKQKLEFWNTPEGRRRVQKYIDENIARFDPNYTVDDYIKEMSEIEYANPIEVEGQRFLRDYRQKSLSKQYQKITEKNKVLVELADKITSMQQNRRMSNTNTFIPEEERNLIDEFTRLKAEYKKEADEYNNLRDRHITENYFPENNAFYFWRDIADKTPVGGGPTIHIGEDYALPSNLQSTLWHEFGHAQNLYPLNKRFKTFPQKAGINFRLRNNLDFEDFALDDEKLREYRRHLKSREKGDYIPPDYVFPTEKQVLKWEKAIPPWLDKSQLDLAKMYENAEPISEGTLGMYRYQDPKTYTRNEFTYFYTHDEANAFLNELIPELMRQGHMTKLGDKIEPKMLKQLFENYRNSGKTKMIEAVRLLDFVKPTEKSLKALAEELNNLQVLLIGAGGATSLKAAGAFGNKETSMEQQKFGGNFSNLQKFIR